MEESQCTLYRPLAFYPLTMSGAVQTGINSWALENENRDLTYGVPFYNETTALSFPFVKQCHEFEQPMTEAASNRTTYIPEFSVQDYNENQINSPWNSSLLTSIMQHKTDKSSNQKSDPTTMNSGEDTNDFMIPGKQKVLKIWRPFSPELDCGSSSNKTEYSDILREQKDMMYEAPPCRPFPTILPSTVILGESSVFKAVKKKKYQCRYCDQWYLNSGQLAGHIRAHIGSKPYRCEYQGCLRAFARNEELTRHRRIHSGVKPHQCDTCQKRFGRKDHLNKHKKTHMKASEKKIYLCEVPGCKHRYTRSDALTRHLSTAHSIKHQKPSIGKSRQNLYQISGTVQ